MTPRNLLRTGDLAVDGRRWLDSRGLQRRSDYRPAPKCLLGGRERQSRLKSRATTATWGAQIFDLLDIGRNFSSTVFAAGTIEMRRMAASPLPALVPSRTDGACADDCQSHPSCSHQTVGRSPSREQPSQSGGCFQAGSSRGPRGLRASPSRASPRSASSPRYFAPLIVAQRSAS